MHFLRISYVAVMGAVCLRTISAQDVNPGNKLQQKYTESQNLYDQKHFAEAAAILEPFYTAGPDGIGREWYSAMYELACEEALAGHKETAMVVLIASQEDGGSVTAEHLASDSDLTSLHNDSRFSHLVAEAKSRERLWILEPGQNVPYALNLSEDAKTAGLSTKVRSAL